MEARKVRAEQRERERREIAEWINKTPEEREAYFNQLKRVTMLAYETLIDEIQRRKSKPKG